MHRMWFAVCVVSLVLGGCGSAESDSAMLPATDSSATAERKAEVLEQNASPAGDKAKPSSSEIIGRSEAQAVDPDGTQLMDDAITCLARTIYWEARGESTDSMEAVASVVMNRLRQGGFPHTVCAIVRQGNEQGACQFSWWCDGRPDQAQEDESYARAKEIARRALNLQVTDRTGGALYFHHQGVAPSWSRVFMRTAEIGDFVFYKPRANSAR